MQPEAVLADGPDLVRGSMRMRRRLGSVLFGLLVLACAAGSAHAATINVSRGDRRPCKRRLLYAARGRSLGRHGRPERTDTRGMRGRERNGHDRAGCGSLHPRWGAVGPVRHEHRRRRAAGDDPQRGRRRTRHPRPADEQPDTRRGDGDRRTGTFRVRPSGPVRYRRQQQHAGRRPRQRREWRSGWPRRRHPQRGDWDAHRSAVACRGQSGRRRRKRRGSDRGAMASPTTAW